MNVASSVYWIWKGADFYHVLRSDDGQFNRTTAVSYAACATLIEAEEMTDYLNFRAIDIVTSSA